MIKPYFDYTQESLAKLYQNLKKQLEIMKGQRGGGGSGGASAAMGSTVSGDDGWVVVPCQDPSRLS